MPLGVGTVTPFDGLVAPNILAAAANTTATYTGFGLRHRWISTIGDGTNDGTVVLSSGANTYFGGTTVVGGATLSVNTDAELGDPSGGITLTEASCSPPRMAFPAHGRSRLTQAKAPTPWRPRVHTTATYTGVVSGNGGLTDRRWSEHGHGGAVQRRQHLLWRYDGLGGATLSVDTDAELGDHQRRDHPNGR